MKQLTFSQACENNKDPILAVLQPLLVGTKLVFEIGSGTGQHAVHFASAMPHLIWQPSDRAGYQESLALRCQQSSLKNILAPIDFDVSQHWQIDPVDAVFTANSLHIMSWNEVKHFLTGVGDRLQAGGLFCVYGPFNYQGQYSSASNAQFDQRLKDRDPLSGIRDFEAVDQLAQLAGLTLLVDNKMPANNRCLIWQKCEE
ncbi:MAG: hypothetical protein ACJA0N_000441 [Pseudohongiellaceae bacterium]|jgi:hypothetical protein